MHPNFTLGFSQHTVTPFVCFQCGTEACAVNPHDPLKRVLHWEGPSNERWEVPAIEVGYRCLTENVTQGGHPTAAAHATLQTALQQAEEARVAAILAQAQAEADAEAARSPLVQTLVATVKDEAAKGARIAGVAGANAVRKDKANGAAA